jgi:hypothetical protein
MCGEKDSTHRSVDCPKVHLSLGRGASSSTSQFASVLKYFGIDLGPGGVDDDDDDYEFSSQPSSIAAISQSGGSKQSPATSTAASSTTKREKAFEKSQADPDSLTAKDWQTLFRQPFKPNGNAPTKNDKGVPMEKAHWFDVSLAVAAVKMHAKAGKGASLTAADMEAMRDWLASSDNYRMTTSYKNKGKSDGDWKMNDKNFVGEMLANLGDGKTFEVIKGSQWHAKLEHQRKNMDKLPPHLQKILAPLFEHVKVVPRPAAVVPPKHIQDQPRTTPAGVPRRSLSSTKRGPQQPSAPLRDRSIGAVGYRDPVIRAARFGFSSLGAPNRVDSVPDGRYREHREHLFYGGAHHNLDHSLDMRFAANRASLGLSATGGPLRMDGQPDMRYKINRGAS